MAEAKKPRILTTILAKLRGIANRETIPEAEGVELNALADQIDALDLRRKTRYDKGKG